MNLYTVSHEYAAVMHKLMDSELPEDCIADTLEGMSGEVVVKAQNVVAFMLNLEAEAVMIRKAEKKMAERRQSIEKRAKRFREYLQHAMELTEISEIKALDGSFVAKLHKDRDEVVMVDDELELPPRFIRTKTEPDKTAIKAAIKAGEAVDGAHIERKNRLEIK